MSIRSAKLGSCRKCGGQIRFRGTSDAKLTAATSYKTCLYECQTCQTRYSNARDPEVRTAFAPRPADNVPAEIAMGLTEVLARAINVANRRNKREKFCAETSEDAITWTVFRWLHQAEQAALVPSLCGFARPKGAASLLLWGAPAGGKEADRISKRYEQVSDGLGERARHRTEIDAILVWDDLVVAVEVKHRSPNDRRSGRSRQLARYVQPDLFAADVEAVDKLGFYELVRNWVFGVALAEVFRRRFLLVNLGPESLREDVKLLRPQLSETADRRAAFLSWRDLVDRIRTTGAAPEWLKRYFEGRQVA